MGQDHADHGQHGWMGKQQVPKSYKLGMNSWEGEGFPCIPLPRYTHVLLLTSSPIFLPISSAPSPGVLAAPGSMAFLIQMF